MSKVTFNEKALKTLVRLTSFTPEKFLNWIKLAYNLCEPSPCYDTDFIITGDQISKDFGNDESESYTDGEPFATVNNQRILHADTLWWHYLMYDISLFNQAVSEFKRIFNLNKELQNDKI